MRMHTCIFVFLCVCRPHLWSFPQPHPQCLLRDVEAVSCFGLILCTCGCEFRCIHVSMSFWNLTWNAERQQSSCFSSFQQRQGEREREGELQNYCCFILPWWIILLFWETEVVKLGLSHCAGCAYTVWEQCCQTLSQRCINFHFGSIYFHHVNCATCLFKAFFAFASWYY